MNERACCKLVKTSLDILKNLSLEKKKQYLDKIDEIYRRLDDPNLNVALIGDFSTGKSTFINAILKQNLLKTAWKATTAIPTFIYFHDQEQIKVILKLKDGSVYDLSDAQQKAVFEQTYKIFLPSQNVDMIKQISTSNQLGEYIERIQLYCNREEQFNNICIIDTPGVNPGAENTRLHVLATREVLSKYTDSTIVLFQAQNVFNYSFKRFLEENASHLMDEAIFVVTMMDVVDEDEREEILEFVTNSLKTNFHLENPRVYGCCAKYYNEANISEENIHWCHELDELRAQMFQHMNERRETIIKKQLNQLLETLINDLTNDMNNSLKIIDRQIEILKQNSIIRLKEDLQRKCHEYQDIIDTFYKQISISSEVDKMFDQIESYALDGIQSCNKVKGYGDSSIDSFVSYYLKLNIKSNQEQLLTKINQKIIHIEPIIQNYVLENQRLFEKYSVELLQNVTISDNQQKTVDDGSLSAISISIGGNIQETIEVLGTLALAPVVIPLAILDGFLGTDISGVLVDVVEGVYHGFINIVSSLEYEKRKAISNTKNELNRLKNKTKQEFTQMLHECQMKTNDQLKEVKKQFENKYETIYSHRQYEFNQEKKILEKEIKDIKNLKQKIVHLLKDSDVNTELCDEQNQEDLKMLKRADTYFIKEEYVQALHYYAKVEWLVKKERAMELGILFFEGKYLPVNYKEALQWFEIASSLGNQEANRYIEKINQRTISQYSINVSDIMVFGQYPQMGNEKTPIEWIVLEKRTNKLLLLSNCVLVSRPFHDKLENVDWSQASLRSWLNTEFFSQAFNEQERKMILTQNNSKYNNSNFNVNVEKDCEDKVFILSLDEVTQYQTILKNYPAIASNNVKKQDVCEDAEGTVCWLRNPGDSLACACFDLGNGTIDFEGFLVNETNIGVRIALWIKTI